MWTSAKVRVGLLALFLGVIATPSYALGVFVSGSRNQVATNTTGSPATVTFSWTADLTVGSTSFLIIRVSDATTTVDSITGGRTYTADVSAFNATNSRLWVYRSTTSGAGAETVTITTSTTQSIRILGLEYTNLDTAGGPDSTGGTATATSTAPAATGGTTTQVDDVILCAITTTGFVALSNAGTGFTDRTEDPGDKLFAVDRILSGGSGTSITNTATVDASDTWGMSCYAYKSIISATAVPSRLMLLGAGE